MKLILLLTFVAVIAAHKYKLDVDEALRRYGYLTGGSAEDKTAAIKKMQKMAGLDPTGILNKETLAYLHKARCGDHDKEDGKTKRYNILGPKWKKRRLSYCIHNWPSSKTKMSQSAIRRAIRVALTAWEPYIPIKFNEISSCNQADFFFAFGKTAHPMWDVGRHKSQGNCAYGNTFNSGGGVLAHAFFPVNGNLHFDDNEEWTEGTSRGINMRIVTIHEMGHALGLQHSNTKGAIMLPYYGGYISERDFRMHKDEIDAVYELYYKRQRRDLSDGRNKRAEEKLPVCSAKKINAVFDYSDGYTYILADDVLYRRNADGVDKGFQKKISDIWKGAATRLQASVFVVDTKTLYLFSSRKVSYAKADGKELDELEFTTVDLKSTKKYRYSGEVSAAFGSGRKKFIYLVEGENLLKFSTVKNMIVGSTGHYQDVLHPDPAARYPPTIDGAYVSVGSNAKEVFFFVGNSYFKGTKQNKKYFIPADYPKHFKEEFLKC